MVDRGMEKSLRSLALALPVLALGLGLVALPGAAQAQFFGGWGGWDNNDGWGGLPARQVRRSIAEQGFQVLGPLRRNGDVFVADVVDQRGRHERLIVAATDAQILQRFYIEQIRSGGGRGNEGGSGAAFAPRDRDGDGSDLVPPASIPNVARRPGDPRVGAVQNPHVGDLNDGGGPNTALTPALPLRSRPPVKTVKPRVAVRTPDFPSPPRDNGTVEATPLAPRPRTVEPQRAPAAQAPAAQHPAAVASRPEPAAAPASPPLSSQPRRLSDPLAIPGSDQKAASTPARSVSGSVTGAPAATPAAKPPVVATPPKAADVPVAPLD